SEVIKMNTSFTAYLLHGEPNLVKAPAPLTTTKTLVIPDDHKEYWGFYLLKGSTFRIRTCARHKGGTLLIVKGRNHLHHCAYIGEADSAGDSDEFSDSNSVEDNAAVVSNKTFEAIQNIVVQSTTKGTSTEEISIILEKIRTYIRNRPMGYQKLKDNLSQWMLTDLKAKEEAQLIEKAMLEISASSSPPQSNQPFEDEPHKLRHGNSKLRHRREHKRNSFEKPLHTSFENRFSNPAISIKSEHGTIHKNRRSIDIRKMTESGENGAFEDESEGDDPEPLSDLLSSLHQKLSAELQNKTMDRNTTHHNSSKHSIDTPNSIWKKEHSHHTGFLDEPNPNQANDGSDSESESSYSSSEEALAKCEGVVASLYLKADPTCGFEESGDDIPIFYENIVNASGYYYFIFGSENEKRDNFIRARFELEKFVYDLPPALNNCTDVHQCRVNLTFWSDQKLVVEIPQPSPEQESVWDEVYLAETECEPRVLLYLIFVVIVPIVIILCAFQ
ncbi:unnamed protein product, partial [Allacma fusca]